MIRWKISTAPDASAGSFFKYALSALALVLVFGLGFFIYRSAGNHLAYKIIFAFYPGIQKTGDNKPAITPGEITSLMDRYVEACLNKDIGLFKACYSQDYPKLDELLSNQQTVWSAMTYKKISYRITYQIIEGRVGKANVSWSAAVMPVGIKELKNQNFETDLLLKKEPDGLKISASF